MMEDNPIIEKIRKLLALAGSPNEHEAALALQRAQELMARYNIEYADLKESEFQIDVTAVKQLPFGYRFIYRILEEYFSVRMIVDHSRGIIFVGTPTNILIGNHVYVFLSRTFNRLWNNHKKDLLRRIRSNMRKEAIHASYFRGIATSIKMKLQESKVQMEQKYGIIPTEGKLDQFVKDRLNPISTPSRKRNFETDAFASGRKHGRDIDIHKPLASTDIGIKQLVG